MKGQKYSSTSLILNFGVVSGLLHAPAALPSGKKAGTHWIRGWVGPKAGLDVLEKGQEALLPLPVIETQTFQPIAMRRSHGLISIIWRQRCGLLFIQQTRYRCTRLYRNILFEREMTSGVRFPRKAFPGFFSGESLPWTTVLRQEQFVYEQPVAVVAMR